MSSAISAKRRKLTPPETLARRKVTPPQLATEWGIAPKKVTDWIDSGELRAVNVATSLGGVKPRWLIDRADIEAFERSRASSAPPPPAPRSRRSKSAVKDFFPG
jgi:hypothetical protein